MKLNSFEIPSPYCIATEDTFSYKAKNNKVFIGLIMLCLMGLIIQGLTTQNTLYFIGCVVLLLITKNPLETKLNYTKGLDKTPNAFSINLGIMRIIILDGHMFSPPAEIAKSTHKKITHFIAE